MAGGARVKEAEAVQKGEQETTKMRCLETLNFWRFARMSAHRFATTRHVVDQATNGALLAPLCRASSGMPSRCL